MANGYTVSGLQDFFVDKRGQQDGLRTWYDETFDTKDEADAFFNDIMGKVRKSINALKKGASRSVIKDAPDSTKQNPHKVGYLSTLHVNIGIF